MGWYTTSRPSSLGKTDLAKHCAEEKISLTTSDNCEHGRDEPSVCLCGAAPEGTYPAPGTSTRYGSNSTRWRLSMEMVIFR